MFVFSGEKNPQIWCQVSDIVMLCFWCPFCIWLSEKHIIKKCRNIRDLGNSVQHWIHLVVEFLVFSLCWYHLTVWFTLILHVNWRCGQIIESVDQPGASFVYLHLFRWLLSFKLKDFSDLFEGYYWRSVKICSKSVDF